MSTRSRLFVHCTMRHLVQALQYSLFVVIRIRKNNENNYCYLCSAPQPEPITILSIMQI